MKYQYEVAVVGGTFDHFHEGHKALLMSALEKSQRIFVGIATSELLHHKKMTTIVQSYEVRKEAVYFFLHQNSAQERVTIVPIHDLYGNTVIENTIDAIFVTDETKNVVPRINTQRKQLGMKEMEMVVVPFVLAEDGSPISSERIRKGEIDRTGYVYKQEVLKRSMYLLPDDLRQKFQKPFGTVFIDVINLPLLDAVPIVIAVGDIVSVKLYKLGRPADVTIVDLKNRRSPMSDDDIIILRQGKNIKRVSNPSGSITKEAIEHLLKAIENYLTTGDKQSIFVDGEEDLLVLPAILIAPLGGVILYGQYGRGVVFVQVTEEKKALAVALWRKLS